MYQVANYGLCLTHSFKTHVTFGFMFGWNMFSDKHWKGYMSIAERPSYLELHGPRISKLIQSAICDWRHPLLLPVILLEDYVYHADVYKGFDLSPRTTKMERSLGVTVAGRNVNSSKTSDFGALSIKMAPEKRLGIITEINTIATDAATFAGNLEWSKRYCQFLRYISKDIQDFTESTQGTAASECSFTPTRSCTTVFASLQTGIHCPTCYIRIRLVYTHLAYGPSRQL